MKTNILLLLSLLVLALPARALDLSTYADESVLASGRWVKISVDRPGMYLITNEQLRQWGFTSAERVRVHGYGAVRIPDVLDAAGYVDDLPMLQTEVTDRGVVFYAVGPGSWQVSNGARYHWDTNIYSSQSYYYVTESDEPVRTISAAGRDPEQRTYLKAFMERLHYEKELTSPGEAGPLLVGEEFKFTPKRNFNFEMPNRKPDSRLWIEVSFVAKTYAAPSTLDIKLNGQTLVSNTSDRIPTVSNAVYYHGAEGVARHEIVLEGDVSKLDVELSHSSTAMVIAAWLNYISVNYERVLDIPESGLLEFWLQSPAASMGGVTDDTRIWDVTDHLNITAMATHADADGRTIWINPKTGHREYTAWRPGAALPQPQYVGEVANQNLHADEPVDMVIFTHSAWSVPAERLANLHRNGPDHLNVRVVDIAKVYNEFASGAADVSALRKYLKMVYDRGNAQGTPLRYALLLGRMTYDNRQLTAATKSLGIYTTPAWYVPLPRHSLNDNDGFGTDDFVAILDDNSGGDLGLDNLSIAVGRIPCVSAADLDDIIDKLEQYINKPRQSAWKHRVLLLADDEDQGVHLQQTEQMAEFIENTPANQHMLHKVYMDAYVKQNGTYPVARRDMFRILDEGIVWWNFVGHANNHSWTHDGQFTWHDMNTLYLRQIPFLYAATCDFLRWDSNTTSGGEVLFKERYGGTIGMISATRPVYISDNGLFTCAMGRALASRDADGRFLTAGEIYRRAKNNILSSSGQHRSNSNRNRYVFMGDPAMRLSVPDNVVRLDAIGSTPVNPDSQATLAALQRTTLTGSVTDAEGRVLDDFDGVVSVEIFDAEQSVTSFGNGEGKQITFEKYGEKLFSGSSRVSGGRFTLEVAMPSEIANNFRPAAMSLYAYSDRGSTDAVGLCRDFFVYGYDDTAPVDDVDPEINSLVLNYSGFKSGDSVNPSPMVIATVTDDVGINISTAGIGHQMTLTLDGTRTFNDVASFFTPYTDGTPGGTINYPLEDLVEGCHTLALRIWDTTGNACTRSIDFFVDASLAPKIFDVYSDANPASERANFYVTHDRPDLMVKVSVTVYNLNGHALWTGTSSGRSDQATAMPVTWDLTDQAGRRVPRGIYLYRATITTDSETYQTASRRIAVTGI